MSMATLRTEMEQYAVPAGWVEVRRKKDTCEIAGEGICGHMMGMIHWDSWNHPGRLHCAVRQLCTCTMYRTVTGERASSTPSSWTCSKSRQTKTRSSHVSKVYIHMKLTPCRCFRLLYVHVHTREPSSTLHTAHRYIHIVLQIPYQRHFQTKKRAAAP